MNNPIPHQLCNTNFKFFLSGWNKKIPIEKFWNSTTNYNFFEPKLLSHLKNHGNIGIVTGYGNLIVIDFDNAEYQKEKESLLPKTFTTCTAKKRLHHLYYILQGEMISKIGIDVKGDRVADIQAARSGVICPPSHIDRNYYEIVNNIEIAEITTDKLKEVFELKGLKQARKKILGDFQAQPEKIQQAIDFFKKIGIPRTKERHFKCPFHKSANGMNLFVMDSGGIYCFHCTGYWKDITDFKAKWEEYNGGIVIE